MVDKASLRTIMKRKLRKLIRDSDFLISIMKPYTSADAHEISERVLQKLNLQLQLNSLMLEDAKTDEEKKKLEEERKKLQATMAEELKSGVEILDIIIANLKLTGMEEKANELEILRDARQSELLELIGGASSP
jgi:23S rRNA pseudoU1915 N3-methylase RlmH